MCKDKLLNKFTYVFVFYREMEELEAIREAEEAALRSAEAAAEEAAAAAMSLDIIDEEELMKPGI